MGIGGGMEPRMTFRALIARPVKRVLEQAGFYLIRSNPAEFNLISRFGYDAFLDIERLSHAWQYRVDIFFDVGANEGQTTLHALERFRNCRIVSFEPNPKTFLLLKERMKEHPRVDLINVALGSEVCDKNMFEYDASVLNSLVDDAQFAVRFSKVATTTIVSCTTVDSFCTERHIEKIDVLKIDTEGLDYEVLEGARSLITRKAIKFIYFEFNDIQPKNGTTGGALEPIDKLIRPHGYRFIASYNDYVVTTGELFLVSNALYALPPE
jgi:FkbM family methyltransferase